VSRRTTLLVISALVLGVAVTAGAPALEVALAETDRTTVEIPGEVARLAVASRNGAVEVRAGTPGVTFSSRWAVLEPDPVVELEDGILRIADGCPQGRFFGSCQVDITVTVPAGVPVEAEAINGAVTLAGREGGVAAATTNGAITLTGSPAAANLTTVNGDVTATLTARPRTLAATTTNGGVTVTLPDGSYAVDASTVNGPVAVDVQQDAGADARVLARSVNGPVRVVPAG
jgi:hypothetical protein